MRFEVAKRFREEKIEMPFGQRDIHLRDLASIEGLVRELFDGRTARAGRGVSARANARETSEECGRGRQRMSMKAVRMTKQARLAFGSGARG